jgi:hypothetical protein
MPRTTLDLDQSVLDGLKARQRAEGKSLGRLASELLARALVSDVPDVAPLRWAAHSMGTPSVDLDDKDALWAALDRS